jgi:valyl-tRNA synthetase
MDIKNTPEKLLKPYNPQDTEQRLYKNWEESGLFNPDVCIEKGYTAKDAEPFSIVLPPPNVTGTLHTGHALMLVIEDIMTRYARMQGKRTLWLPGTDHAAIATQSKVEKILEKEEGKRKTDLGREEFLKRVEKFAQESHDTIVGQARRMGASLDWSREAFTLDEKRSFAVRTAFKTMFDEGLIYRGHRIVNWDPKGQTVISDDEIVYKEENTKFYYLKYGPFTIGTARPETKFGDKYVVMHPDDTRYSQHNHGDKITVEWINGPIEATIIKDSMIDMEFGTGVMTITPWHSVADFELAEKHKLDKEQIIDKYGKLLPVAGEFAGIKIKDAREKIIEKLQQKGLVEKVEDYTHNIATAERTDAVIEPQVMNQWFINVNKPIASHNGKTLKDLMLEPVKDGKIKIVPEQFERVYMHWITNLRDWCISRQIWYGHRIPVWYKGEEIFCGVEAPEGDGWTQDEDSLDTWFSSGLWTFSTLGWPEITEDFKTYHPTAVLETGYDILPFWVARMILMSTYLLNDIPFKTVYFHGLVRDEKGRKMSKSLGNIVDPITLIDKHGTDALRMAMIVGVGPGNDSNLGEDKIKAYSKFANKLWNITRFVLENTQEIDRENLPAFDAEDQQTADELDALLKEITGEMNEYKFYLVAEKLYHYSWHTFADVIIERSKTKITENRNSDSAQRILVEILPKLLRALHPFMPFVTEELWSLIPEGQKGRMLMVETWPCSH